DPHAVRADVEVQEFVAANRSQGPSSRRIYIGVGGSECDLAVQAVTEQVESRIDGITGGEALRAQPVTVLDRSKTRADMNANLPFAAARTRVMVYATLTAAHRFQELRHG
ncbi:MAG: hypothetical protein ACK5MR_16815, partial [Cumulibacter sp.]